MVQAEIQAAQDAALGSQKLGLGEGASAQEAEGGGLRVGETEVGESWTLAVTPCPGFGSVPVLDLSFLVCKMGPLMCCAEVLGNTGFGVRKTWIRVQTLPRPHCVTWTFRAL